ncbi:hypothetical protein FHG64_06390 [Antarcticibacterium flavum]|uniref:Uncharacterized protein n=1 Tax=Antarcticibacterium flavum TaxID=2058175 RepID=A0A5B7X0F8_9FLAO|nr:MULTISPECIES: hypothetical protein [Antarcticibacterium]MCM4161277.1 hypothetical protein [Antarcticibacterium sp. W02-3]QCY69064.1 hypothetical protein FHG64_06390 [Antarcticibacterium flavum]
MEKFPTAKIIEFRRKKSDSSKLTLLKNLKTPKIKEKNSEGGNYWTTSISAISKYFKTEEKELILDKINDLLGRYNLAQAKTSKGMYLKNIEILHNFENFDFTSYKPESTLSYKAKPNEKSIVKIKGVPLQIRPQHVYSYKENNEDKIGAIWFVSIKDGFNPGEIGIFTEALNEYLFSNYSKNYIIEPDFCIAVDVSSLNSVKYSQITSGEIPSLLHSSLESIQKLL